MDSYDTYYQLYPTQEQIDAYNAQFVPQKPIDDRVGIDASLMYNQGYIWNQPENNVPGVMEQQGVFLIHPEQMMVPTDLWQQQLDYSNASNAQYMENWNLQPQQAYTYQPEHYPHVNHVDLGIYNQEPTMSPPMAISPHYSIYSNQFPQSCGSSLSTTPPNEYHSSGSDGDSDDVHSHVPLSFPSAPPNGQWHPAPIPITPEPQEEPEPESSSQGSKKSYYRPRHLQNVSNITRSLVRDEGALPRPRAHAPAANIVLKKKKACTSCKKRKISCAPPTVGVKCNQCQRTGYDCDLE